MKRLQLLLIFLLATITISDAQSLNTDSILKVLDNVIANTPKYEAAKRQRIKALQNILSTSTNDTIRFGVCKKLFYEYRKFKIDSALYYANERLKLANRFASEDSVYYAMLNKADGMKSMGQYNSALQLLRSIPSNHLKDERAYYFYLMYSVNLSLFNMAYGDEETRELRKELMELRDSVSSYNTVGSTGYVVNRAEILMMNGKTKEAYELLNNYLSAHRDEAMKSPIFFVSLSDINKMTGNKKMQKYYLAMAAILDKKDCCKTYTSLQSLALLLNSDGDTERAYRYITCAMNDMISSNARNRLYQISEVMPIITNTYNDHLEQASKHRLYLTILVTLLVFGLIAALFYTYKCNIALKKLKKSLDKKNEELSKLNYDLNAANAKLRDGNKIKEEYIAQLFSICSGYIDSVEKFRMSLGRKLKANQLDAISRLLAQHVEGASMKEFFRQFDAIFLDLHPSFIDDFNSLLEPDACLRPREDELLSPELRIYALVRLGVNDSTRIADFLHYSTQTVYNYRLKVRSHAIVPRNEFVEYVQRL